MAHNQEGQEKRRHPRIFKKVPIKVRLDSCDVVTETQNISLSGAYCEVDKYITPMTKIDLIMLLPIKQGGAKVVTKKVNCTGVVVRSEKSQTKEGKFNIALYFTDMKKADMNTVARYIKEHSQANL